MSKPRYDWWGYIKAIIRRFPATQGAEVSGVALREKHAVEAAVAATEHMSDAHDRLKVVELVLWKGTHTLEGAAMQVPCSERTARRWLADFIVETAKNFSCDGLVS